MNRKRVAFIGLDSMEPTLAESMMERGELPELARLRQHGVWCRLHDDDYRTGLVWEHLLTGRGPRAGGRWSPVRFDPDRYRVMTTGALLEAPFFIADPPIRTIAFDVPYTSLAYLTPGAVVTGWGAHDPGYPRASRPRGLLREIDARFGPHPCCDNDYACTWYRPEALERQTRALIEGARRRPDVVRWLMDRFPDWDLLITVLSEPHSAGEQLWHGIDASHPLASVGTAESARDRLLEIYRSVDAALGSIVRSLPDDTRLVVASLHGMQTNTADVLSMALLPELLYRWNYGAPYLRPTIEPGAWRASGGVPLDNPDDTRWLEWLRGYRPGDPFAECRDPSGPEPSPGLLARLRARWAGAERAPTLGPLGEPIAPETTRSPDDIGVPSSELLSQPAIWYRDAWPGMRAFAIPTFYDGRIRLNLHGRERDGIVPFEEYGRVCDEIETLLHACRDPRSGRLVVDHIERLRSGDPMDPHGSDGDLSVVWSEPADAIEHPDLGRIGPYLFRRTGGHSPRGMLSLTGPGIDRAELPTRSSRDLTPTLLALLGRSLPADVEGQSLPLPD